MVYALHRDEGEMRLKSNPFPVQWAELVIEFNSWFSGCSYASIPNHVGYIDERLHHNINDNNKWKCICLLLLHIAWVDEWLLCVLNALVFMQPVAFKRLVHFPCKRQKQTTTNNP